MSRHPLLLALALLLLMRAAADGDADKKFDVGNPSSLAPSRLPDHTTEAAGNSSRVAAPSSRTSTATSTYISLFRYVCPAEFLRLGNGCYFFSKDMADWSSAHFECRERESQLVVVGSEWEDKTLRRYLNRAEMTRLNRWLGGLYDWSREAWVWGSSGDLMRYTGFLSSDSTSPRSPRWKCAFTAPSLYYRWNYAKCSDVMHYICEAPFTRLQRRV